MDRDAENCLRGVIFEPGTMAEHLGIRLVLSSEDGRGVVAMPLGDRQVNKLGYAHGGALFTLADMAATAGCFGLGLKCVSAQSSISYLTPGRQGPLRAEAAPVKAGKSLIVYDVDVYDGSGARVAKAMMNCFVIGRHMKDEERGY